jgi:hypothetical protein
VRALLAHGALAGSGDAAWRTFLADADARWAAELAEGAAPEDLPRWLSLPQRLARVTA